MNKENETRGIFVPENILRHKKMFAGAKLLYGEIASICERDGYCTKRNAYFAKLYRTNVGTISRWINSLKKSKFIKYRIKHKYIRTIFLPTVDDKTIDKVVDRSTAPNDESKDIHKVYRASKSALNNTTYLSNDDDNFDFDDEDIKNWLEDINVK